MPSTTLTSCTVAPDSGRVDLLPVSDPRFPPSVSAVMAHRALQRRPGPRDALRIQQQRAHVQLRGTSCITRSAARHRSPCLQAGDVGFVPASFGHYVENTGNTTLRFLEIFNTNRFEDISLSQVRRPRLHEPPDMSAD